MDANRLRTGEKIAGAAALVLLIVMFIGWFGIDSDSVGDLSQGDLESAAESFEGAGGSGDSFSANAWESFGFIDIVLLITILAAAALVATSAMAQRIDLPVALSALTAGLGILSTLLILYRLIDTPFGFGREIGVFLGLLAAAGIAYGGWKAMQEEGTTFGDQSNRGQGRGDATPPPPPAGPAR